MLQNRPTGIFAIQTCLLVESTTSRTLIRSFAENFQKGRRSQISTSLFNYSFQPDSKNTQNCNIAMRLFGSG